MGTSSRLNVWCEEGAPCRELTHSSYSADQSGYGFNTVMYGTIFTRATGTEVRFATSDDYASFDEKFSNNLVEIPFTTAGGDHYVYKIRPESSMNIYVTKKLQNPDFSWRAFVFSLSGDEQNDFNAVIQAPEGFGSMSDQDYTTYLFAGPFSVFYTDNLSKGSILNIFPAPDFEDLSTKLPTYGTNPYFVITP